MHTISYYLKICVFVGITLISLNVLSAHAAFDGQSWQYYRTLNTPASSDFVKVTLPDTSSRDGYNFSDIRIVNQDNVEIPYFLTKNALVRGGEKNTQIIDQTSNNGIASFVVDSGIEGSIHTAVRIDTSVPNFRRQVKIYSSSSLIPVSSPQWNLITDTGYIFRFTDPSSGFISGKNNVDFTKNTSRYFKVVIETGEEGVVSITRATLYGETRIDVPSYLKVVPVTLFNNPNRKTTEVTIDLGETGHITDAVTLTTSDRTYSRRVVVGVSDDSTQENMWRKVGEGSISSVSTPLFTGTYNRITYPEQKTRYIRFSIVNDDNRPLSIGATATVEGPVVSAVFETRPGESYRLFYGNPSARTPTYDIGHISTYIETGSLPATTLGPEVINPVYVAPVAPLVPFTESHPLAMNILLVVIVTVIIVGIAWYLYLYFKKRGDQGDFTGGIGNSANTE